MISFSIDALPYADVRPRRPMVAQIGGGSDRTGAVLRRTIPNARQVVAFRRE
jgi:hypothetical protein